MSIVTNARMLLTATLIPFSQDVKLTVSLFFFIQDRLRVQNTSGRRDLQHEYRCVF